MQTENSRQRKILLSAFPAKIIVIFHMMAIRDCHAP